MVTKKASTTKTSNQKSSTSGTKGFDNLVIVESPSKAKTLTKMLGNNYFVTASKGHVRDLPKSTMGIDIENNFSPKYVVPKVKTTDVNNLKKLGKTAKCIYLATDPDREGEAIAWHLSEVLGFNNYKRVEFHEITKEAIDKAFKSPRTVDINLVNAQQARRIEDRLVGYNISPVLWKKVRKGLSAGRVQSVAVKIIVDRENEINEFIPQEYWNINCEMKKLNAKTKFKATLIGTLKSKKIEISNKEACDEILNKLKQSQFSVNKISKKEVKRSPNPPFITSTLQQEAWKHYKFTGKKTMSIAQQLYEGISIGKEGEVGLITYMRTDSTNIAASAVNETREYINEKYGKEYLPTAARSFSKKVKGAQEAHEGIRPTKIHRDPASIKEYLTGDQLKLYQLIWNRMVASQMAEAVFDNTIVDILAESAKDKYILRSNALVKKFNGFSALYVEKNDDEENDVNTKNLPVLKEGEALEAENIEGIQNFTKAPGRYTEASLIKCLEQNGIGRPSTYATIISTIQEREYVIKEAGSFKPTDLGIVVNNLLKENFSDIVDIEYTAKLEAKLDDIANGKADWVNVVKESYEPLMNSMKKADSIEHIKIEDEPLGEDCPVCGKPMVIKTGRFGKFGACSNYPDCKTTKKLSAPEKILDEKCPVCGKNLSIKSGRYGKFKACSDYPNCKYIKKDTIETGIKCPDCPENCTLIGRYNKRGSIFYGCSAYPKHKFAINYKPLNETCPKCGGLMVEKNDKPTCINCNKLKEA